MPFPFFFFFKSFTKRERERVQLAKVGSLLPPRGFQAWWQVPLPTELSLWSLYTLCSFSRVHFQKQASLKSCLGYSRPWAVIISFKVPANKCFPPLSPYLSPHNHAAPKQKTPLALCIADSRTRLQTPVSCFFPNSSLLSRDLRLLSSQGSLTHSLWQSVPGDKGLLFTLAAERLHLIDGLALPCSHVHVGSRDICPCLISSPEAELEETLSDFD